MELTGWPVRTIVHGQTVFVDCQVQPGIRGKEIQFMED
jgi:hypothetical protein